MSITRRETLRNLGLLGAASALPLPALGGGFFAGKTGPDKNFIYVLFEGPWLFIPAPDSPGRTHVQATASMMDGHECRCGRWMGQDIEHYTVARGEAWNATLLPDTPSAGRLYGKSTNPYSDYFMASFKAPSAVVAQKSSPSKMCSKGLYLEGHFNVATDTDNDVRITLPVPEVPVELTATYKNAQISSNNSGAPIVEPMVPSVVTIFKYKAADARQLNFNWSSDGSSVPQASKLLGGEVFVFRMAHVLADCMTDEDHINMMYQRIGNKITDTTDPGKHHVFTIQLPSMGAGGPDTDNTNTEDFGPVLLGVKAPSGVYKAICKVPPLMPMGTTLANCDGGGIGVDPSF